MEMSRAESAALRRAAAAQVPPNPRGSGGREGGGLDAGPLRVPAHSLPILQTAHTSLARAGVTQAALATKGSEQEAKLAQYAALLDAVSPGWTLSPLLLCV